MEELKSAVRSFMVKAFLFGETAGLADDTSFLDSGIIDSTGILELVAFLEDTFAISIGDEELVPENLDSIDRVAAFVDGKLAEDLVALTQPGALRA